MTTKKVISILDSVTRGDTIVVTFISRALDNEAELSKIEIPFEKYEMVGRYAVALFEINDRIMFPRIVASSSIKSIEIIPPSKEIVRLRKMVDII